MRPDRFVPRRAGMPAALVAAALAPVLVAPAPAAAQQADTTVTITRSGPGDSTVRREIVVRGAPGGGQWFGFGVPAMAAAPVERRSAIGIGMGEADTTGLLVTEVLADGPAAKAGLQRDDRLLAVNGTSLRLAAEDVGDPMLAQVPARRLERAIGRLAPGSTVRLTYLRGRQQRTATLTTVAPTQVAGLETPRVREFRIERDGAPRPPMPPMGPMASMPRMAPMPGAPLRPAEPTPEGRAEFEARMRTIRDSARAREERRPALGLAVQATGSARDTLGLFVRSVTSGGPAEKAGIVEGDRIATINGADVRVPRDEVQDGMAGAARASRFTRELQKAKPGDEVTLRVWHDGAAREVRVRAGKASEVLGAGALLGGMDGAAFELRGAMPFRREMLPPGAPRVQLFRMPAPEGRVRLAPRPPRPARIVRI